MAQLRVKLEGDQIGPKLKKNLKAQSDRMNRSLLGAAADYAAAFLERGRANIAAAGNFKSARWQEGLFSNVTRGGANIVINNGHKVPYWIVFQEGRVIRGKPLLWIPLSFGNADGKRARDYEGRLFRVNRKNGLAPLLLDADTKKPQYFGKASVKIPKKFRVLEIGRELARQLKDFYNKRFAADKGK